MSTSILRRAKLALPVFFVLASAATSQEQSQRVEATLELEPTRFDFAGTREAGMMYMPSSVELTSDRPDSVAKEPEYRGSPRYGTLDLGNASNAARAVVIDVPEDGAPRIWLDLDGDGDLAEHGDGAWHSVTESEGRAPSYSGTWTFDVTWVAEDGTESTGSYGLNFYWSPDRPRLNYYRAAARVGRIQIGEATYRVTLIENDGDALFDKRFDGRSAEVVGESPTKPVWLMLDGDRFDARGTFQFGGMNWLADVSADGSRLSMEPTFKVVRAPEPTERPEMLGAGGDAPDFEAMLMAADGSESVFRLSDFEGECVVVLDLWATWCGPCIQGLPHLSRLGAKLQDRGVTVIALNSYDDEAAYRRFVEKQSGDMPGVRFARDPAGREREATIAKRLFRVTAIPATYVIGKDGKIAAAISGYREGDESLENALESLGVSLD